jgi:hypothetical protein
MATSEASKEAAWLEKLLADLSESGSASKPPTLYIDNLSAIDLIHDHRFYAKAKHIGIRFNFIRNDIVEANRLLVKHIPGTNQPADSLTKQLPVDRFRKHIHTLGIQGRKQQIR